MAFRAVGAGERKSLRYEMNGIWILDRAGYIRACIGHRKGLNDDPGLYVRQRRHYRLGLLVRSCAVSTEEYWQSAFMDYRVIGGYHNEQLAGIAPAQWNDYSFRSH